LLRFSHRCFVIARFDDKNATPENIQIISTTNIYDNVFQKHLKAYCHHSQIPFMENDIPRTCINAAKVYYRMIAAGSVEMKSRFPEVVRYLTAIPFKDIDEKEDPINALGRWRKFFESGTRPGVNIERALKNKLDPVLLSFINDRRQEMTDKQLVRSMLLLAQGLTNEVKYGKLTEANHKSQMRLFDELFRQVVHRIQQHSFEFHKGSTLAGLAEVFVELSDTAFYGSKYP